MTDEKTFTCDHCGGTFPQGWSDEACAAERDANFPGLTPDAAAIVCDDCFAKMPIAQWREDWRASGGGSTAAPPRISAGDMLAMWDKLAAVERPRVTDWPVHPNLSAGLPQHVTQRLARGESIYVSRKVLKNAWKRGRRRRAKQHAEAVASLQALLTHVKRCILLGDSGAAPPTDRLHA